MKYLRIAVAALIIGLAAPLAAEERGDYRTDVVMLLTTLAETAGMASGCEEAMHELGKDALDTDTCKRFVERYESLWGDRDTLQRNVLTFARRVESGQMPCDARCHDMLRRCEELRVSIVYVLDYVDFMRTL